jgi:hypothetical protein
MVFSGIGRLLAVVLYCLLPIAILMADEDDDKPQATTSQQSTILTLDTNAQTNLGLATTVLAVSSISNEVLATGKAISIQPLLALRHRYLAALTEHQQLTANFQQAQQVSQRQQSLYQNGIVAKRQMQEQTLQVQSQQTLLRHNQLQRQAIRDEARLAWGKPLADGFLAAQDKSIAGFLTGQTVLLQITLPMDKLPERLGTVYVSASGQRQQASKAVLISAMPQTDTTTIGQHYFFRSYDPQLKPGMRLAVWLPEQQQASSGVLIPKAAVVWWVDQALIYVKTGNNQFTQRPLNHYTVKPDGYFTDSDAEAGEEIVTTGAQMLLSEQQRRQIPDEDD